MNRATLALILAVTVAEGCSAEDPTPRQADDAAVRDTRGTTLYDVRTPDRLEGNGGSYDGEGSVPPNPPDEGSAEAGPDVASPPDVRSDPIIEDSGPPRPDASLDAPPTDALVPADAVDAPLDSVVLGSCLVTFSVNGVVWSDGGAGSGRVVRLVGDVSALGAWTPTSGIALSEIAPGTWSGTVTLRHLQLIEFKFVKIDSGAQPEWESWLPYDSNRSMQIDCGDGGAPSVDASDASSVDASDVLASGDAVDVSDALSSVDTADVNISADTPNDAPVNDVSDVSDGDGRSPQVRAIGNRYSGTFGVRPLDATK